MNVLDKDKNQFEVSKTFTLSAVKYVILKAQLSGSDPQGQLL